MSTFDSNIYNMSDVLHDMSKHFVPEEDEETMALGLYGFLNSVHSMYLANDIRIAQENANEMFFNRARLSKNVMAYAIENGIEGIAKIARSNKLTPELITNYTRVVFKDRLEVIFGK